MQSDCVRDDRLVGLTRVGPVEEQAFRPAAVEQPPATGSGQTLRAAPRILPNELSSRAEATRFLGSPEPRDLRFAPSSIPLRAKSRSFDSACTGAAESAAPVHPPLRMTRVFREVADASLKACPELVEGARSTQLGDAVVKAGMACAVFLFVVCCLGLYGFAGDLNIPATVTAGTALSIPTSGSGEATLYLVGPGTAIKRKVQLGGNVELSADELQNAGRYVVALDGKSAIFFVTAGPVHSIAFLARPSRVPADTPNVVSGTAFLFDRYQNLVLKPQPVKFELDVNGQTATRSETSKDGVAYTKLDSSKKEGPAQFTASSGDASVRRVVQEVASDPCNIRMTAQRDPNGILVRTDPIRDCAGNPVPDGTIVTFTSTDAQGKSTVDARIKRGIAQAQLPASKDATISVASGVVVGNEIKWRSE